MSKIDILNNKPRDRSSPSEFSVLDTFTSAFSKSAYRLIHLASEIRRITWIWLNVECIMQFFFQLRKCRDLPSNYGELSVNMRCWKWDVTSMCSLVQLPTTKKHFLHLNNHRYTGTKVDVKILLKMTKLFCCLLQATEGISYSIQNWYHLPHNVNTWNIPLFKRYNL